MAGFVRIGGLVMVLLAVAFIGFSLGSSSAAAPVTVGIDFNTADNTSTSVGAIQTCLEVASGGTYTVDVYVQNV